MKSGASADDVYVSKLWYLKFDFLGDQDIPSASVSNLEEEDGSEIEEVSTRQINYLVKQFIWTTL